jgi:adenine-specific DNA-methyltransferase
MVKSPGLTLVQSLARAVSEAGPAHEAADRYATHLAQYRGADEATLTARDRDVDLGWGADLPVSHRLYCAELSVVLRELLPLLHRLGSPPSGRGPTGPDLAIRLRGVFRSAEGDVEHSFARLVPRELMAWLGDATTDVCEGLAVALADDDRAPRPEPFEDVAQARLTGLLPAVVRHDLGIHYTPGSTAREVVRRALEAAAPDAGVRDASLTVMDPACGTGVFLLETLRWKWLAAGKPRGDRVWPLLAEITGVEASPLTACVARLGLVRAAVDLAGPRWKVKPKIKAGTGTLDRVLGAARVLAGDVLCDLRESATGLVLGGTEGCADAPLDRVQVLVGNPPWVAWDALPAGYKQRLALGLLKEYDLFDLRGFEARLGGANDDLSGVFTLVVLDRLLVRGGRLAFLLKLNLLTNESARTFRRFEVVRRTGVTGAVPFAVEHLCDLRRANPFAAAVEPALLMLVRDRVMGDTLPSERWERGRDGVLRVISQADYTRVRAGTDTSTQGPWALRSTARSRSASLAGDFPYDIRHGLKHDCNGVFLVELLAGEGADRVIVRNRPETARRIRAPKWTGSLERTYLRPLMQSRHIRPLALTGWAHALVPATARGPATVDDLAAHAPATLAYLEAMRPTLATRKSKVFGNPPFFRVFAVGPYNWAPSLVVWCGMALRPWFAVVDEVPDPLLGSLRPLPDSSCYLVPLPSHDEACFLAGLLNSGPVRAFLASRSSGSKRGLSRAVVSRLGLPRYDPDLPDHRALAAAAHAHIRLGTDPVSDAHLAEALDPLARRVLR